MIHGVPRSRSQTEMPRFVQTGVIDSQLDGRVVVKRTFGRLGAPRIIVVINNIYQGG